MNANLTISVNAAFRITVLTLLGILTYLGKIDHEKLWTISESYVAHEVRITEIERRLNSTSVHGPISYSSAIYGAPG